MKASLELNDHSLGKVIKRTFYKVELDAQNDFDKITENWSEWDGKKYSLDLMVKHPTLGPLCRRTMYTDTL